MEAKCHCRHCNTHIAFDAKEAGAVVTCPACGMETQLFIPPAAGFRPSATVTPNVPKLKPAVTPLETRLESIGSSYLIVGVVVGVLLICDCFLAITQEAMNRAGADVVLALVSIGQGYIVKTLFQFLAEHLRLTRKNCQP